IAALAGELTPVEGLAALGGVDVRSLSAEDLALRRAVLEQTPALAAPFTVGALARLAIGRRTPPREADLIASNALEEVGLADLRDVVVARLSGGQRRRAHLARALAQLDAGRATGGGEALILDEPTAGVDFAHQIEGMRAARGAATKGAAVVASLHDLSLAAAFADRIVVMRGGEIVADDAPEAVLRPAFLSDVYDAPVDVFRSPGGALVVAPKYANDARKPKGAAHVHRHEPLQDPARQGRRFRGGVA
ncbi:MAG: ATP-binding cassette domain-containing protein, partial [Pseudomonadota bacterium]